MQHVGTADLHTFHIAPVGAEYENVGFAGGDNGTVFMTLDGGWTWKLGPNVGQQTVLGLDQIGEGHR
jgi:hypothetical protein